MGKYKQIMGEIVGRIKITIGWLTCLYIYNIYIIHTVFYSYMGV